MRRKDREAASMEEIVAILGRSQVGRLGLSLDGKPYVVPLNYGFSYENGQISIWLHGANSGLKLEILKKNPQACFEVDGAHKLIAGDGPCECSYEYESAIVSGLAKICESPDEKSLGLSLVLRRMGVTPPETYPESALEKTAVIKLEASSATGKRHLP